MGAVFGTSHFHVTLESGFEAGYPSLPEVPRQGYMGDGGGGRRKPQADCALSDLNPYKNCAILKQCDHNADNSDSSAPIKLHYSQTTVNTQEDRFSFETPIKLHYSQTTSRKGGSSNGFETPKKLHYSQTSNSNQHSNRRVTEPRGLRVYIGESVCATTLYHTFHKFATKIRKDPHQLLPFFEGQLGVRLRFQHQNTILVRYNRLHELGYDFIIEK